ncbi:MAG TPA: MoaD/ThiS family protein [Euzebyales bacterium]|nr:MoaD/ThiS family protein [Euzebyales bacterium]
MAVTVRLFAALRDAAGTAQVEVAPDTVPAIVADLCDRFGEPFATRVTVASGMLDGRRVALDEANLAADGAELALLPPFSGGSTATLRQQRVYRLLLAGSLLVPLLLLVGVFSSRWAFGLVVVVVAVGSLIDLHATLGVASVRTLLPTALVMGAGPPTLLLIAPDTGRRWVGGVLALAVMTSFLLAFASPRRHETAAVVGSTLFAGLLVAVGAATLVALHDQLDPVLVASALAMIALTDAAVVVASRPTVRHRKRYLVVAAVATALPSGLVVYAASDVAPPPVVLIVGFALAAVVAALASARFRQVLRRAGTASEATGEAVPALLIGTADAVLLGVPLALLWAQLVMA